jgi:hypothetical protein
MKNKNDHSQLFSVFKTNLLFSKNLLLEFEKFFDNKKINESMPRAKLVYMEIIILNLAKIFSKLKCDKFGIVQLKNISPEKNEQQLTKIEESHIDIIGKIISNRNKIIAHTDKDFDALSFSDNEIKSIKKDIEDSMEIREKEAKSISCKMNRAISKDKEKYTPRDLKRDSLEIKNLIEEIDKVFEEVLMSQYNKHH